MALAYTAPTWQNGGGVGISASQLQALSDCMEGLVQGSDKAITNISISGQTIILTFADGSVEIATASGLKGISNIAKTGTSGLVDTYTITFTDGSTSTFTVTNGAQGETGPQGPQGPQGIQGPAGADGADGQDGISPEITITTITGGHTVEITDTDHPQGQSFDVMDGAEGKSAYESAVDGGFVGTESEFNAALGNFREWTDDAETAASNAQTYAGNASISATAAASSASDASDSATEAAVQANIAAQYADYVVPRFIIQNNRLYLKDDSSFDFMVANNRLYIKVA